MYSLLNPYIDAAKNTQLLDELGILLTAEHPLAIDSRKVTSGGIFCAYPGSNVDGRKFIAEAIANGAELILWQPSDDFTYTASGVNYPVLNLMQYVGILGAKQLGYPSAHMDTIAVTGTNGKTSIV